MIADPAREPRYSCRSIGFCPSVRIFLEFEAGVKTVTRPLVAGGIQTLHYNSLMSDAVPVDGSFDLNST